jgi:hypothetical protein
MMMNDKPWMCGPRNDGHEHHVLGQVVRDGSGVRRLLLYRLAVDMEAEEPGEVDVMAVVIGQVVDVRCSICGKVRTWVPGEEALRQLIEGIKRH